jgi:hypothetical protein
MRLSKENCGVNRRRRFKDQSVLGIVWHMLTTERVAIHAGGPSVADGPGVDAAPDAVRPVAWRVLVALGVAGLLLFLIVSGVVLTKRYQSSVQSASNLSAVQVPTVAATQVPTPVVMSPLAGSPAVVLRAYGSGVLLRPQEAVRLPQGDIAVADAGHHRVVVLSSTGKLVRQITQGGSGALQSPFSLALATGRQLLVLDSDAGQIDEYGEDGKLLEYSALNLNLGHSRGIAVDAAGQVLVADPAMNAIVTLGADLTLVHTQVGTESGGTQLFNQPSAVAIGKDGSIYVVDSQNGRLAQFTSDWKLLRFWPIAMPDTQHSVRMIPLADGRVLASDPVHDALLLFDPSVGQAQSFSLPGGGEPLGVTLGGNGDVLVTCNAAGEVVDVKVQGLKL